MLIFPPHVAAHVLPVFVRPRNSHISDVSGQTMTAVWNVFAGAGIDAGSGTEANTFVSSATEPRGDVAGTVTFTRGVLPGTIQIGAASA